MLTATALRASSRGWAKPARPARSSIFSKTGAHDNGMDSRCVVFFRRRISHQHHTAFCQRCDGTAVSKPVCATARRGSFVFDGQCALGLFQPGGWLCSDLPDRRLRSACHGPCGCAGARRSPHGAADRTDVRTLSRRQFSFGFSGGPVKGTFRSLKGFNYRLWAGGAIVSNVGTWMQRIAQGWLVLTQLTHNNATAMGVVMALQFGPHLLLLPLTGFAADHLERRKLLIGTQAAMGALAFGLGTLTVTGLVQLWHVYVFAFLLGCVTAFDSPARHTFVSELVGEADLSNAVALNSTSFNAARMIGPAIAGTLIASVGSGWVFLINAASFVAVLCSLVLLRVSELHVQSRAFRTRGSFATGFRYVSKRPDLKAILLMLFLIATFGLNFQIFISTMSVTVFHAGASQYGFLTSVMAIGTVAGALLAAEREKPHFALLLVGAVIFGFGCALAAVMPNAWLFGIALVIIGASALTFTNSTNSLMQLSTEPVMRGRVMAIRLAIAVGCTPIGAPIVGWVADRFGPRWALGVGAASGVLAAVVAGVYLAVRSERDARAFSSEVGSGSREENASKQKAGASVPIQSERKRL